MKKRIYSVISGIVITSLILLSIFVTLIYYSFYKVQSKNELKAITKLSVAEEQDYTKINSIIEGSLSYAVRVTLIGFDGVVIYDSQKEASSFKNHSNRPEFIASLKNGEGEDLRISKSIGQNSYYYAIKTDEGVVRFSRELNSISSLYISIIPFVILAVGVIMIATTYISSKLSDSIIYPVTKLVNELNIFKNNKNIVIDTQYEELIPIAKTVKNLSKELNVYIAQLIKEKETISYITENMAEGMILLNEELNILSVNRSSIRMLNPSYKSNGIKNILQLTRNTEIINAIKDATTENNVLMNITIKDEQTLHLRISVNNINIDGLNGYIVLIVDITDSFKAEEIRRDFSANVSHELKTPLTTIKGFGEMLSCGIIKNSEDVTRYGATIFRESERLLFLINDIIRLSEIEEIGGARELVTMDLKDVTLDVISILELKAKQKNIHFEIEENEIKFVGNHSYMSELFLNLIDNAIKYNNPNGEVKISFEETPINIIITISDNGIGISKQNQERIFERFYRVDKSRSKQTGGTGLGLSIVKHIVLYHKGNISINSDFGIGTTIKIELPKQNI